MLWRFFGTAFAVVLAAAFLACGGSDLDDSLTNLEVGDCILDSGSDSAEIESVEKVDCDSEGLVMQVTRKFDISGDEFPGVDEVDRQSTEGCPADTEFYLYPTEESWEGADDREVVCFGEA